MDTTTNIQSCEQVFLENFDSWISFWILLLVNIINCLIFTSRTYGSTRFKLENQCLQRHFTQKAKIQSFSYFIILLYKFIFVFSSLYSTCHYTQILLLEVIMKKFSTVKSQIYLNFLSEKNNIDIENGNLYLGYVFDKKMIASIL